MSRPSEVVEVLPPGGLRSLGVGELSGYMDLFGFLVWRDVKARYAQSVLGVGWALFQPVMSMLVFTVVFGGLANIRSDGIPYSIFSYAALVPWTYFSNAMVDSTGSLLKNSDMLQKIYFPRVILPASAVLGRLMDFFIAITLLVAMMIWFGISPTWWTLALPAFMVVMVTSAFGLGLFLSALAVQYRDVAYGLSFVTQLLIYSAPVVYPVEYVPEAFRLLYALNPMVGVIEGFRASLLGTTAMPWDLIGVGSASAALILIGGIAFFRWREPVFADVV